MSGRGWQSVREEVLRRISSREWRNGQLIPNEADLALELGCSRSTVNRALRSLADSGLLVRRRKGGTRVAHRPVARATFDIRVLRDEIEAQGCRYDYELLDRRLCAPGAEISAAMQTGKDEALLGVRALHLSDGFPYASEDRWINCKTVPKARDQSFEKISANEWLVQQVPYTHGDIAFQAVQASQAEAACLGVALNAPLLAIDRLTWDGGASVTKVRLHHRPDYRLRTSL